MLPSSYKYKIQITTNIIPNYFNYIYPYNVNVVYEYSRNSQYHFNIYMTNYGMRISIPQMVMNTLNQLKYNKYETSTYK